MTTPAIVFPRPWIKIESDVLEGFDCGRFATALMGSERVILEISSLAQLAVLVKQTNEEELAAILSDEGLTILYHPDMPGVINIGVPHLATITHPANARENLQNPSLSSAAILSAINRDPFTDVEISSNLSDLLASRLVLSPPNLQARLINDMARDMVDIRYRKALSEIGRDHFGTAYSPLDCLKVIPVGEAWSINIDASAFESESGQAEGNASTFLLMMAEAYKECALAAFMGAPTIYTDEVILRLINVFGKQQTAPSAGGSVPLEVVTKSIQLPSIGWMVNRGVLPLSDVLQFVRSKNGSQFRDFLLQFTGDANPPADLEKKMQTAIINSFHEKTWWEKHWSSTGGQLSRLTITQLPGMIPGWGTLAGTLASLADMAVSKKIPQTFRPTVIVEAAFREKLDDVRLRVEQRRKLIFPSLAKLQKRGFEATMAMMLPNRWVCLVLDKPGIEEHWNLKIDLNDPEAQTYFSAFDALLPPFGTKQRQLVELLGNGALIEGVRTKFAANSGLTIEFTLRDARGALLVLGDDSPEFVQFVMGRAFLRDPLMYEQFRRKQIS